MFDLNKIILYEWTEFYYLEQEIDHELSAFKLYLRENFKVISKIKKEFSDKIRNDENLNPDWEHYYSYFQHHYQYEEEITLALPKAHYHSSFLSIMAFVENKLLNVCMLIEEKMGLEKEVKKIARGRDKLGQYWVFLNSFSQFELKRVNKSFYKIKRFQKLRNSIAHSGGVISENQRKLIKDINGIKLSKYGNQVIFLDDTLPNNLLIDIEIFFDILIKCINDDVIKMNKG